LPGIYATAMVGSEGYFVRVECLGGDLCSAEASSLRSIPVLHVWTADDFGEGWISLSCLIS
jgi:hypothetical protein